MTNNKLTDAELAEILSGVVDGVQPTTHEIAMARELLERRRADNDTKGWISVNRELPGDAYHYLPLNLLLNGRTVVQGGWQDWRFWLDGMEIDNVTDWMPLPKAPGEADKT